LGIALLVLIALVIFGNYQFTKNSTSGHSFLVQWNGLRGLLIYGQSPYGVDASDQNQLLAYGRPARVGEDPLWEKEPLYSVIFTIPFALLPYFPFARAVWMTLLELVIIGLAVGSIRLMQWRVGFLGGALFLLFSLTWYHSALPLLRGDNIILVAFFIMAGLLAVRENADELAGVFFAFSSIKPQAVVAFLIFILIWGILKRRWKLVGWMVGTIVILGISAMLLIPDWMGENLRAVILHPDITLERSPIAALQLWIPAFGARIGLAVMLVLGAILIVSWIVSAKSNFRGFLWTACLTLALSQFFSTDSRPDYLILLFPALTLVLAVIDERWRRRGQAVVGLILLALFIGLWALALNSGLSDITLRIQPVMYFPLPILLTVALFWVRWWAIHPPSNLLDPVMPGDYFSNSF
jgi:hypothetical protein